MSRSSRAVCAPALADADHNVRYVALMALCGVNQTALAPHTRAIVRLLADADDDVRHMAAITMVGFLAHSVLQDTLCASNARCNLGNAVLKPTASAIVTLLSHHAPNVRCVAVNALGNMCHAAVASYAGANAGLLGDTVCVARCTAVELLALACSAVASALADEYYDVCIAAERALVNLKRMRARLHWATARVFVQVSIVRPYALFWHEVVGERLCAPGGKWSELDRAAFVDELM